jgi:hypothetical protein
MFIENNEEKHVHFSGNEFKCSWTDDKFDKSIRKNVPLQRTVSASNEFYTAHLTVSIQNRIPFLREQSFFVKHFFIAEEMSAASWTLVCNKTKKVLSVKHGIPSGGETAQSRWWVPIVGSVWNHASMGTSKLTHSSNTVSGEISFMHS